MAVNIKEDLKEIKADVKVLLERSAVHNQILAEHKAYSLALQKQQELIQIELKPIQKHVDVVGVIAKFAAAILVGVLISAAAKHYLG